MEAEHLLHLAADLHQRVHTALGLLEHHADVLSLDLPQLRPGGMEQVHPIQQHLAGIVALAPGQQPRHAHGGDGLAGAGFAHQSQDLTVLDGEGHARHRLPAADVELHMQITDLQHHITPRSARCSPSPIRPALRTSSTMARPVPTAYQGAAVKRLCASESMYPRDASGGVTPMPR